MHSHARCKDFRACSAMCLACMVTMDTVQNSDKYDKAGITQIWQYVAGLGLSRGDLPAALKAELDSNGGGQEKGGKRKREQPSKSKAKGKKRKGGNQKDDLFEGEDTQPDTKKLKVAKKEKKEKKSRKQ